ncbi:hypothetical protein FHR81_002349 [Actinoalloteichus hoggarensis]|uniref:Uncharacterized protein n=1 Tax=Actinoalloteichus hoggarensis TaxID=1470176 RepID=A0A221W688_9PSEU|nr:hypothetical protein [Actinoalloteichus hoggarensis]ASO21378.1 hypothetical protein AHOG_18765 [Actinoalloteichus hoggarensis]MBB5921311.1 hypothetical protein [Actinoalloteichus hoggarensis]
MDRTKGIIRSGNGEVGSRSLWSWNFGRVDSVRVIPLANRNGTEWLGLKNLVG